MHSPTTYSVVGVRSDGARIVISQHVSLPVAERVLSLIRYGREYKEFRIALDGDWPPGAGVGSPKKARPTNGTS